MALKLGEEPREELPAPIGDNSKAAPLSELLAAAYPKLPREAQSLKDRILSLPPGINSDASHGPWADLARDMDIFLKKLDAYRVHEKDPFLAGTRIVDNHFKSLSEPIEIEYELIARTIGEYLESKKQRAEIALRAQRQAAEQAAQRAADEKRRLDAEAKKAIETAAKKIVAKSGVSLATAKRRVAVAPPAAVSRKIEAAGEANYSHQAAERRIDHVAARQAGPAATHARTRSSSATSTLQEEWDFEITNLRLIPLEELRPYFHTDAFEKAIRGLIKAGRRELKGVRIFKKPRAQIR